MPPRQIRCSRQPEGERLWQKTNTQWPERMSNEADSDQTEYLSPENLRQWLEAERKNLAKELELRLREASEFVTAYGLNQLTPKEADERYFRYQKRWGFPLCGLNAADYSTDARLIGAIDNSRNEEALRIEAWGLERRALEQQLSRYRTVLGRKLGEPPER